MYEFASGTINVLEKKIFNKLDQERMISSPDKKSALSVLLDTDLGARLSKQNDIEEVIKGNLQDTYNTLAKILVDNRKLFWFLFLKYDALNIKIALKKKLGKGEVVNVQPFDCAIDKYQDVEQVVLNPDKASLPEINIFVYKLIKVSLDEINSLKGEINSKQIEEIVDKAYFQVKNVLAEDLGSFVGEVAKEELAQAKKKSPTSDLSRKIILQARDVGMGESKVLAFLKKKMNGYNNIRLILFTKENNLDISEIEGHLLPI